MGKGVLERARFGGGEGRRRERGKAVRGKSEGVREEREGGGTDTAVTGGD